MVKVPDAMPDDTGRVLKPHRNLKTYYLVCLLVISWAGVLPWLIPLSFLAPPPMVLAVSLPLLAAVVAAVWWIAAYHRSICYRFTESGIIAERGTWSLKRECLSYRRIAAVRVTSGPLGRLLGISRITIEGRSSLPGEPHITMKMVGIAKPDRIVECIEEKRREAARREDNRPPPGRDPMQDS